MSTPNLRQKIFFDNIAFALDHNTMLTDGERQFCSEMKKECDPTIHQFNTAHDIVAQLRRRLGMDEHPKWVEFIGYHDLGAGRHLAMYQVSYDRYTTSLLEPTLVKRGIPIPDHPDYETWKQQRGVAPLNGHKGHNDDGAQAHS